MHIPDGFLSPQTYLPAWGLAAAAWWLAVRGLRHRFDEETIPRLAVLTALAYGLGLVMLPLPGGTSGHALGVAPMALIFGIVPAFLAYSLVLLLQALLFGAGGITALGVNALSMGLAGATAAVARQTACGTSRRGGCLHRRLAFGGGAGDPAGTGTRRSSRCSAGAPTARRCSFPSGSRSPCPQC
jgi:cobalamin biosynthesis protein CbiM